MEPSSEKLPDAFNAGSFESKRTEKRKMPEEEANEKTQQAAQSLHSETPSHIAKKPHLSTEPLPANDLPGNVIPQKPSSPPTEAAPPPPVVVARKPGQLRRTVSTHAPSPTVDIQQPSEAEPSNVIPQKPSSPPTEANPPPLVVVAKKPGQLRRTTSTHAPSPALDIQLRSEADIKEDLTKQMEHLRQESVKSLKDSAWQDTATRLDEIKNNCTFTIGVLKRVYKEAIHRYPNLKPAILELAGNQQIELLRDNIAEIKDPKYPLDAEQAEDAQKFFYLQKQNISQWYQEESGISPAAEASPANQVSKVTFDTTIKKTTFDLLTGAIQNSEKENLQGNANPPSRTEHTSSFEELSLLSPAELSYENITRALRNEMFNQGLKMDLFRLEGIILHELNQADSIESFHSGLEKALSDDVVFSKNIDELGEKLKSLHFSPEIHASILEHLRGNSPALLDIAEILQKNIDPAIVSWAKELEAVANQSPSAPLSEKTVSKASKIISQVLEDPQVKTVLESFFSPPPEAMER